MISDEIILALLYSFQVSVFNLLYLDFSVMKGFLIKHRVIKWSILRRKKVCYFMWFQSIR